MRKINNKIKSGLILALLICLVIITFSNFKSIRTIQQEITQDPLFNNVKEIKTSSCSNQENIEAIFERKLSDYTSFGYFPQIYEPSLQATFFAIYILDALGKLELINQTDIINYIMAHYDIDSHIFLDDYARRYLDIDFLMSYFPLTSLLEVNCYAILTLYILGHLDLIDRQQSIDFIWSCFNPEGKIMVL